MELAEQSPSALLGFLKRWTSRPVPFNGRPEVPRQDSAVCPSAAHFSAWQRRTEHHPMKMLRRQLSYFVLPFYRYTSCLTQPFASCLSPLSLLGRSPFCACEAWRLVKMQPPSLALPCIGALFGPEHTQVCEPAPAQTWKMASFCQTLSFPAVALPWESFGTCKVAPHRQQKAHLDKCLWRDHGFSLQRKTGSEFLWSMHFTEVLSCLPSICVL